MKLFFFVAKTSCRMRESEGPAITTLWMNSEPSEKKQFIKTIHQNNSSNQFINNHSTVRNRRITTITFNCEQIDFVVIRRKIDFGKPRRSFPMDTPSKQSRIWIATFWHTGCNFGEDAVDDGTDRLEALPPGQNFGVLLQPLFRSCSWVHGCGHDCRHVDATCSRTVTVAGVGQTFPAV